MGFIGIFWAKSGKALEDGYTQGEVARYLGLSSAMISKIFRNR